VVGCYCCLIILRMTPYTICWGIRKCFIMTGSTFILYHPMSPFQNIKPIMYVKRCRLPTWFCTVTRGTISGYIKLNMIWTFRPLIIHLMTVHTSIWCSLIYFIRMTGDTTFRYLFMCSSQWIKLMPISGLVPSLFIMTT
jgi:hypothetical protein